MKLRKLQRFLFYFLLFLIPSNLGKHFILPSSYVSGILVDYLVPTFYLTDIIILLILLFFLPRLKNHPLKIKSFKNYRLIIFIFSYLLLNTLLSLNKPAAFYKLFRLLTLTGLFFYIKSEINIKKDIKKIALVLSASAIFQSLLAISQWFTQGSIFNNYLFLGEQPYSLSTPGIKKISFFGILKAPPLGTFSHPNVLAGFLVLTFPIILNLLHKKKLLFTIYTLLMSLTLFLTFSLPAWLAFGLILITLLFKKKKSRFLRFALYALITTLLLFFYQNFSEATSFSRRQTLNEIASKMFFKNPLTGVGLNNFTSVLEKYGHVVATVRFLQPVHNVYLLILAETGVIGLLLFLFLTFQVLKQALKQKEVKFYVLLFAIYFLAFFDHYLFTSQQGLLLSSLIFTLKGSTSATTTTSASAATAPRKAARRTTA